MANQIEYISIGIYNVSSNPKEYLIRISNENKNYRILKYTNFGELCDYQGESDCIGELLLEEMDHDSPKTGEAQHLKEIHPVSGMRKYNCTVYVKIKDHEGVLNHNPRHRVIDPIGG